jgi:hypothetical protein
MIAATMNVATHVTVSNCLEDSRGSPRSINVQAASIVARNGSDQYRDAIVAGEKKDANVTMTPYINRRREGADLGKGSFPRRSRTNAATGITMKGSAARIESCQS